MAKNTEENAAEDRVYRVPFIQSYTVRKFFKDLPEDTSSPFFQKDPLFKALVKNDGETLPALHDLKGGMYLSYEGVRAGEKLPLDDNLDLGELEKARESEQHFFRMFGKKENFTDNVELITEVDAEELRWMEKYDAAVNQRKVPPEPPQELEHLFCDDTFRAYGKSFTALEHLRQQETWRHKAQKNLEKRLFGEPEVKETFHIAGLDIALTEVKLHPVYNTEGKAIGIRCPSPSASSDDSGAEKTQPPEGWHEIKEHAGVFAPDPDTNPQDAGALDKISFPDYKAAADAFGADPIITAEQTKDGYPRTYQNWPHVDLLGDKKGAVYYINVPQDYKGDIFRPADSIRITDYEYKNFFHSTGDMYEPHLRFPPVGVPYPDDFTYTPPEKEATVKYYRLAGRSAKIYEDFKAEKENISKMRNDFIEAVGGNGGYGSRGPEITMVSFANEVPQGWKSIRKSEGTIVNDDGEFEKRVSFECKPDKKTKEGRKFAKQMKSFPEDPDYFDLQNRWTPEAPHMPPPQWDRIAGNDQTVHYDTSEIDGPFVPPPDAVEVPTAAYEWYKSNKLDIQCGIKPPPMPAEFRKQVDDLLAEKSKKKPPKPSGPKAP